MGKKVIRSKKSIIVVPNDDFVDQKALSYEETCSFDDNDTESLKSVGDFSTCAVFRPFDSKIQPDIVSSSWVFFLEYSTSLGLSYSFVGIISEFFEITKIPYIQAMPAVRMNLYWIDRLNWSMGLNIGLNKLAYVYALLTFRNSHFLLKVKNNKSPLVLKSKHNDGARKGKHFSVICDSIPNRILLPIS